MKCVVVLALAALVAFTFANTQEIEQAFKCAACEIVIEEAESIVQSNTTQAALTKLIDSLCQKINIQSFCDSFLVPYVNQILQAIIQKIDPTKVCQLVKLCSNTSVAVNAVEVEEKVVVKEAEMDGEGLRCSACTVIINYVQKNLVGEPTADKIQQLITTACGKIPFAGKTCTRFIAPIVAKLVVILAQKLPADQVCTTIGLCDSSM